MLRILFVVMLCFSISAKASDTLSYAGMSKEVFKVLQSATKYMGESKYDSAQYLISGAFSQIDYGVTTTDVYYLYCYQSEIMYYNALFELGLNSSLSGLQFAKQLKNDTLIGSCENLIGLFLLNLARYDEAVVHFREALKLIPKNHDNEFLAYNYHTLANLGECFYKMSLPDSAIYYSELAIPEAQARGRQRGVAWAYWNLAESWLLKGNPSKAHSLCLTGYELMNHTEHRDVVQTLCTTFMHIYLAKNLPDSVVYWMNHGQLENNNSLNTDLSRITFLQESVDACIQIKDIYLGVALLERLNEMQKSVENKQQSQRIAILKDYYEKNQKLVVAGKLGDAQKEELKLRRTISWILAALVIALIVMILIGLKFYRQRQRITQLKYNEELQRNARELELSALEKRMEAVYTERNRIASDLHDDIGAALSSIRIYSGAALKQHSIHPEESLMLINRINQSSTGMMERMSDIVWSINPKNDNVQSMVLRMKTYAGEILESLDIQMKYVVEQKVDAIQPTMIARRNIYLIFKEAINNVAKYSKASQVIVSMNVQDDKFHLHIDDNGIGFHVNHAQSPNGLLNMSERAKGIGGEFHISSHVGRGTQLHLTVEIAKISDRNTASLAVSLLAT